MSRTAWPASRAPGSAPIVCLECAPASPRSPDVKRRRTTLLAATGLAAAATYRPAGGPGRSRRDRTGSGTAPSSTTTAPWWTTSNVTAGLSDGQLCADVPGGTTNRWDAAVGQNDITLVKGESYKLPSRRRVRPRDMWRGRSSGCRWRRTTPTTRSAPS
ncbi:carbohydrate binding domain-containing protein [Streptomyces sp. L7]